MGHIISLDFFFVNKKYAYTMADTAESKSQDSLPITKVTLDVFFKSVKLLRNDFKYSSIAIYSVFYNIHSQTRGKCIVLIGFTFKWGA